MEIAVIGAVEHIQAIEDILAGMRVHDVQENRDSHSVSGVDEFHELLGCPFLLVSSKVVDIPYLLDAAKKLVTW